ncbi:MAG: alpha/beta hydrolase [Firmicutes bacterium]|nr:alpha/beta hydrolase [Bacillota bacterium]
MTPVNGKVKTASAEADYIAFGSGERDLIILPGAGDGFRTVKGTARAASVMYRSFGKVFRVWSFSRRDDIPQGFGTDGMADDVSDAMDVLGIERACIYGVSQGGMIAQQLAIRHPEKVERMVLAVTSPGPSDVMRQSLSAWLAMADARDYKGIMEDTAERSYTGKARERYRKVYALAAGLSRPDNFERFKAMCSSCITHDVRGSLDKIACPVLVIGASQDAVVGPEGSKELAEGIKNSALYMYEGLSHGAYEQAKDFNSRVLEFLKGE